MLIIWEEGRERGRAELEEGKGEEEMVIGSNALFDYIPAAVRVRPVRVRQWTRRVRARTRPRDRRRLMHNMPPYNHDYSSVLNESGSAVDRVCMCSGSCFN